VGHILTNMIKHKFEIGDVFNYLTINSLHHTDQRGRKYFLCKCKCGNEKVIQGSLMTSGNTKSCGCFGTESRKAKRISENHCEVTAIILQYKRHAKSRGLQFLLPRDFVEKIVGMNCHYCGVYPSNFMKTKNSIKGLAFSGIDRVNSSISYIESNVVPCCKMCNYAKSNYTISEFKDWAIKLGNMAEQWGERQITK
jgi:hypothetical protein